MNNALSLFHGMGCFNVACDKNGESFDNIYTAEIDKYANIVDEKNNPDNISLGDVEGWRDWPIDWSSINLVVAGSPCQGFSFAGKGLAFDDPRSKLFFVFIDILEHVRKFNPTVDFMLENVRMEQEHEWVITNILDVDPIMIDSALVNAQHRKRNYWCNWNVKQPEDRWIMLKDILETDIPFVKCSKDLVPKKDQNKAGCLTAGGNSGGNHSDMDMLVYQRGHGFNLGGVRATDGKSPTLTSHSFENNNFILRPKSKCVRTSGRASDDRHEWDKISNHKDARRYTPIECERLMGLPDNYTNHVCQTQRYKMCGNGWECYTAAHVLASRHLPGARIIERQGTLF